MEIITGIEWFEETEENEEGITSIAFSELNRSKTLGRIVGYNGILNGERVIYNNEEYTVVMVSRMGDFGLSLTGKLPYTIRASPKKCNQVVMNNSNKEIPIPTDDTIKRRSK